jgi:outer membrane protein
MLRLLVPLICALALAPPVQAGQALTLRAVLSHAWATSPDLAAARAELATREQDVERALAGWRPTVGAYADITDAHYDTDPGGTLDGGTEKSLGLEVVQPLYTGGSTRAAVDAARAGVEAARADLARAEQALLRDAATVYMDVVEATALLGLASANQDVIAREAQAVGERFALGDLTRTDVSQADARLARARADVIEAQGLLEAARARFTQVVGLDAGPGVALAPPPDDVLAAVLPPTRADAVARARADGPEVRAARASARAAELGIRAVEGELWPQVALAAGVDQVYDPINTPYDERAGAVVGVRATLPLYQGGDTRARIRQARSGARQASDILASAQRAAESEAIRAWTALEAARAAAQARTQEVDAQRVARDGVRAEADLGARTVLDVLNADQEYLDAQAALVSAQRTEVVARFALAATLGALVPPVAN